MFNRESAESGSGIWRGIMDPFCWGRGGRVSPFHARNCLFALCACLLLSSCIRPQNIALMNDTTEHQILKLYKPDNTLVASVRVEANKAVVLPGFLPDGSRMSHSGLNYRLFRDDGTELGSGEVGRLWNPPDPRERPNSWIVRSHGGTLLQIRNGKLELITEPQDASRGEWTAAEPNAPAPKTE